MKDKILSILREKGGFVSGQEICAKLSVSRTAVWKAVNRLKAEGYNIEGVNNRGYRLVEAPDLINVQEIKSLLHTSWFGSRILYFDEVDSTNNEIKRQAEIQLQHGLVAIAERQTAGRGRRGHTWTSPSGEGIWLSFMVTPDIAPVKSSMLTLVAAMAVAHAINEVTGLEAKIKWPNDIVVNGKKVCGMLTELSAEMTKINYVVIGIGINVNMTAMPDEIRDIATSLRIEGGEPVRRAVVVEALGRYFEKYYDMFLKTESLGLIADEYNELLVSTGKQVKIVDDGDGKIYTAIGINDAGELVVEDDKKTRRNIRAGEVSVRGLYGYV